MLMTPRLLGGRCFTVDRAMVSKCSTHNLAEGREIRCPLCVCVCVCVRVRVCVCTAQIVFVSVYIHMQYI